jgi:V8-like Glu-specific endopeptidase
VTARTKARGVWAGAGALVVVVALGGCAPTGDPIGYWSAPIVDGEPTDEHDAVVYVTAGSGAGSAMCTGSLVAPQLVLTAKHCIDTGDGAPRPPEQVRVYTGPSATSPTAQHFVSEVRPAPGSWEVTSGTDVAVLFLAEPAAEEPMALSFQNPVILVDRLVTAVGYGMTPSGDHGVKLAAQKQIERVDSNFLWIEPAICPGDSGGPVIGPDAGAIWGVASFIQGPTGTEPQCGTAPGAYTGIRSFEDFLLDAISDSGHCVPTGGPEMCNGRDDTCDGVVDEGCLPLGDPCDRSDECTGGLCADPGSGPVCTQRCNPLEPSVGCPPDMHCTLVGGCDGLCAPGVPGADALGLGGSCREGVECHSLLCGGAGDAPGSCMQPCRADAALCLAGEACSAAEGCGGCVLATQVDHPRGLGEPCRGDGDCASTLCWHEDGTRYCSRPCGDDDDCVRGFHCRGTAETDAVCIRGPRQALGGRCIATGDCVSGTVCAWSGQRRWCTQSCDGGECPPGFRCDGAADICAPERALVGEACEGDDECMTGMCAEVDGRRVCTQPCGPEIQCAPGLECFRVDDRGGARCAIPRSGGGGCSAAGAVPGAGGSSPWWLLLVLVIPWLRRTRHACALACAGVLVVGCTDVGDFETAPGEVYRGTVRGTAEASFIRRGFPEGTTLEMTFDAEQADFEPGLIRTDDTACGDPVFQDTPLRAVPPLAHDQLSLYDFPGATRVRNFIYLAAPEAGPLAGQEAPVFVSLLRGGKVEVRIMAGFGAGPCDLLDDCTCFFGVFELTRQDETP